MAKDIGELVDVLFRRGFNPAGVAFVLRIMAEESIDPVRREELEAAANEVLGQ